MDGSALINSCFDGYCLPGLKNSRMTNHKPKYQVLGGWVIFAILLFIALTAMFLGCKKKQPNPYQDNAVINSNEVLLKQKDSIIAVKDTIIAQLQRKGAASEQKQSEISNSFKPVYEKINSDTGFVTQFNYLQVLLAEHKRTPVKRD